MSAQTRIFAVGETVYDIIFKDGKPINSTPGGSMLNTAVSLGRLGMNVYFISEYGNDAIGKIVDDFLRANGVATDYVCRYDGIMSALALAFLDDNNNPEYSFYKQYPDNRLDIDFPELAGDDVIIYGSFYGIEPKINTRLKPFLQQAHEKNALVIYDPNCRKAHLEEMNRHRSIVMENFAHADIVKGSDEDFQLIFGAKTADQSWLHIKDICDMMIYTANKNNVELCMPGTHSSYPVPQIAPVSAIGAGDSFNAGLIYGLITKEISRSDLKNLHYGQRASIIERAIRFAENVCMSYENYISPEFVKKLSNNNNIL